MTFRTPALHVRFTDASPVGGSRYGRTCPRCRTHRRCASSRDRKSGSCGALEGEVEVWLPWSIATPRPRSASRVASSRSTPSRRGRGCCGRRERHVMDGPDEPGSRRLAPRRSRSVPVVLDREEHAASHGRPARWPAALPRRRRERFSQSTCRPCRSASHAMDACA